ncbi:hypothetical protein [Pseudomonas guariconensis]|uniref:hypothetical protein n=1 Tax=Pseudomonas guariconensis TaxID=1288410 RepID=UPI0018AB225D|nr:hypothetical protein [Pseudomonas guariconensis]MBF8720723.1 hypothetical protein [Pseudomonas guariconensis]MBF8792024.1 hypothetical protein [Pseudomonas monteilii]
MIDEKLKEAIPNQQTTDVDPVDAALEALAEPELEAPETFAEPEQTRVFETIEQPEGPIDPLGPVGQRRGVGKEGPDLTNAENEAFEKVQARAEFLLRDVLPAHGLDPFGDWIIHAKDDFSERSHAVTFLTWAFITGTLQKPDVVEYEDARTGEVVTDTDGNFWAALQETFNLMMRAGVIA